MADYIDGLNALPSHMRDGMQAWIETGRWSGSFLMAVICNDLMDACARADDINKHHLFTYASFLYNDAPSGCYGSTELARAWEKQGGLRGLQ